jgi:hypothetical protein
MNLHHAMRILQAAEHALPSMAQPAPRRRWLWLLALGIAMVYSSLWAHAAEPLPDESHSSGDGNVRRIALVIGNDGYDHVSKLENARADAQAMARSLEKVGFKVMLKLDTNEKAMKESLRAFKAQIQGGDVAVFYYSGHGIQLGMANYLLPTDVQGKSEEQVKDEAIPFQRVLDDMQEQKARFSLAIIDACRNNPFRRQGRAIGGRGLAPTTAATGQVVLFSAGSGQEALDKVGEDDKSTNGVFTRVLLKEIERPGISIDKVLRNVREEVVQIAKSVNHEQVPALYDQSLGDFYFIPPVAPVSAKLQQTPLAVAAHKPTGSGATPVLSLTNLEHVRASDSTLACSQINEEILQLQAARSENAQKIETLKKGDTIRDALTETGRTVRLPFAGLLGKLAGHSTRTAADEEYKLRDYIDKRSTHLASLYVVRNCVQEATAN